MCVLRWRLPDRPVNSAPTAARARWPWCAPLPCRRRGGLAPLRQLRARAGAASAVAAPAPVILRLRHPDPAVSWNISVRAHDVVAVIMGGGAGTRLFPLTKDRAKPAVPLAGSTAWWTSRSATASTPTCGGSFCLPSSIAAPFTGTSRRATASTPSRPGSSNPRGGTTPGPDGLVSGHRRRGAAEPDSSRFLSPPAGPHPPATSSIRWISGASWSSTSPPGPKSRWPPRRYGRRRRTPSASWKWRTTGGSPVSLRSRGILPCWPRCGGTRTTSRPRWGSTSSTVTSLDDALVATKRTSASTSSRG